MRFSNFGVGKQFPRFGTDFVVVEDLWVPASQLPRLKKRRPVDIGYQLGEIVAGKRLCAEERRFDRLLARPIDFQAVLAGSCHRDAALGCFAFQVRIANLDVFRLDRADVGRLVGLRQQC